MELAGMFQFSIENALEMVIVFDVSGEILYANPAAEKVLKYKETVCGVSMREVFPNLEELKRMQCEETEKKETFSFLFKNKLKSY